MYSLQTILLVQIITLVIKPVFSMEEFHPTESMYSFHDVWLFRLLHNIVGYLFILVPLYVLIFLVKNKFLSPISM